MWGVTDSPRIRHETSRHTSLARWSLDVGLKVASAALCLVEPRALTAGQRGWYRAAVAATTAGSATCDQIRERGWRRDGDGGWFAGIFGTVFALAGPLERFDVRISEALEDRGRRRHRVLEAGVMLTWALSVGIRSFPGRDREQQEVMELQPLSPEVRTLLERILGAIDDYGARELRAQLESAQEARCEHGCSVDFEVAPDAPRTKVAHYDFPVALCGDDEGAPVSVVLWVSDGRLGELEILREGLAWEDGLDHVNNLDLEPMDWF